MASSVTIRRRRSGNIVVRMASGGLPNSVGVEVVLDAGETGEFLGVFSLERQVKMSSVS